MTKGILTQVKLTDGTTRFASIICMHKKVSYISTRKYVGKNKTRYIVVEEEAAIANSSSPLAFVTPKLVIQYAPGLSKGHLSVSSFAEIVDELLACPNLMEAEIQEMTKRTARTIEDIDRAFLESAERFFGWIPAKYRWTTGDGMSSVKTLFEPPNNWTASWALRITAKPMGQPAAGNARQWLPALDFPTLRSRSHSEMLQKLDLNATRTWQPRLRAFEREFDGDSFNGVDRVAVDGQIERKIFQTVIEAQNPKHVFFSVSEFLWSVASVFCFVDAVRCQASRPSQTFAVEIELLLSNPLYLVPHPGPAPQGSQILPPSRVLFPRYEIGLREEFDELLTTIETDLWNSAGYQPAWKLAVDWPVPRL